MLPQPLNKGPLQARADFQLVLPKRGVEQGNRTNSQPSK